ncbi:protein of unknown function [Vibrio tapetis subsp. tapetis]|uniref:Uncharacterized protein n=1 Tax=Vibrio tapetis subsp. tapetis TaxID=1671868 RepID=A0A2N8ZDR5_9VIBR|nr:protein of unknown function [Vibrio tapetis subsp. tapetis]
MGSTGYSAVTIWIFDEINVLFSIASEKASDYGLEFEDAALSIILKIKTTKPPND